MLDQIEERIARGLSEQHFYPYAQNIYLDIFKAFSFFPLKLNDVGIEGEGQTITFLALVILKCREKRVTDFYELFHMVRDELNKDIAKYYPLEITVETFLGTVLYYYHPVDIRNVLLTLETDEIFNDKQRYEYDLKKKTLLIFAV
jgi:hypothetical protein